MTTLKGRLVFSLLASIVLLSCNETTTTEINEPEIIEEIIPEPVPDSTAYYDSVYAPLAHKLDSFFLRRFDRFSFNGNVLLAEKGRIVFENSYGFAEWKEKDTLTIEHTFQLASVSKPITAIATLQLVEQGKISLTDTIEKFIPSFPYSGINVHMLLSHRSGLSKYTHFCDAPDSVWPDKHKTIFNSDVVRIIKDILPQVAFPPDKRHYYSNTNYMLLAQIIEKASGMSYKDYLQKHIFDSCGMTSTVLYMRDNKDELVLPVIGYESNRRPALDIYLNGCVGDKGIYTNVHDLLKFDQALYDSSILSKKYIDLAFTEHNKTKRDGKNYGYGFRLTYDEEKGKIPYHTGWWRGFRTYFIRIPKKQQTIIILTNIRRGPFFNVNDLVKLLP